MGGTSPTLPLLPEPDTLLKASRILAGELEGAWATAHHLQEFHLADQMANLTGSLPAAWGAPGAFPRLQVCSGAGPTGLLRVAGMSKTQILLCNYPSQIYNFEMAVVSMRQQVMLYMAQVHKPMCSGNIQKAPMMACSHTDWKHPDMHRC